MLCSVDVAVIIFGHNKKLYEYSSGDISETLARYQYVRSAFCFVQCISFCTHLTSSNSMASPTSAKDLQISPKNVQKQKRKKRPLHQERLSLNPIPWSLHTSRISQVSSTSTMLRRRHPQCTMASRMVSPSIVTTHPSHRREPHGHRPGTPSGDPTQP